MIIEWFLGIVGTLWEWCGSLLPEYELDPRIADPGGFVETFADMAVNAGQWVEWNFVIPVGLLPAAVWAGGVAWKVFRTAFSHVPLIGGAG